MNLWLTPLNRGWLNAVVWLSVPKIPGRETEVRHEVQFVCSSGGIPSSLDSNFDPECQCAGDGPARRYPSEVHTERTEPFFRHGRGRRPRALSSALGNGIRPTGISARKLPRGSSGIGPGPRT